VQQLLKRGPRLWIGLAVLRLMQLPLVKQMYLHFTLKMVEQLTMASKLVTQWHKD
jgi:hypothetical protein